MDDYQLGAASCSFTDFVVYILWTTFDVNVLNQIMIVASPLQLASQFLLRSVPTHTEPSFGSRFFRQ